MPRLDLLKLQIKERTTNEKQKLTDTVKNKDYEISKVKADQKKQLDNLEKRNADQKKQLESLEMQKKESN